LFTFHSFHLQDDESVPKIAKAVGNCTGQLFKKLLRFVEKSFAATVTLIVEITANV